MPPSSDNAPRRERPHRVPAQRCADPGRTGAMRRVVQGAKDRSSMIADRPEQDAERAGKGEKEENSAVSHSLSPWLSTERDRSASVATFRVRNRCSLYVLFCQALISDLSGAKAPPIPHAEPS